MVEEEIAKCYPAADALSCASQHRRGGCDSRVVAYIANELGLFRASQPCQLPDKGWKFQGHAG